jgi:O-methyltransferase involved in polyketide biosynthesis
VRFVDAAVERYLATINQFVILGAGFDTRAFRLPRRGQIRCFEVDMPQTQSTKRQLQRKAGIDSVPLRNLGMVARSQGDYAGAADFFRASIGRRGKW